MTLTIRCSCGARFTVEQDETPAPVEASNDPGDATTQAHHPGWTDTGLGFTTPALTTEDA